MQILTEKKCIVRIACSEVSDLLLRSRIDNVQNPETESIRISEAMQVNLLELEENSFRIRAINSADQFLDPDSFTEWIFMVTPLKQGHFSLILKVSVIEHLQNFGERKKELVFDKQIDVVNDEAVEITDFEEYDKANLLIAGNKRIHESGMPQANFFPSPPPPVLRSAGRRFTGGAIAAALVAVCVMSYLFVQSPKSGSSGDVAYEMHKENPSFISVDTASIPLPASADTVNISLPQKENTTNAIPRTEIKASDIVMQRGYDVMSSGKTASTGSTRNDLLISFRLDKEKTKNSTGEELFYLILKNPDGNVVKADLHSNDAADESKLRDSGYTSVFKANPDSLKMIMLSLKQDSAFQPGVYEISIYQDGKLIGSQESLLRKKGPFE